jgi:hypothetical protein
LAGALCHGDEGKFPLPAKPHGAHRWHLHLITKNAPAEPSARDVLRAPAAYPLAEQLPELEPQASAQAIADKWFHLAHHRVRGAA